MERSHVSYLLLVISLLLINRTHISAQARRGFSPEDAEEHFRHRNYLMALPVYKELLKKEPENTEYNYKIAVCYLNTHISKSQAIKHLEWVSRQPKFPSEAWFELGRAYHFAGKYDEAIKAYTRYKEVGSSKDQEMTDRQIEMCSNAKQLSKYPVNVTFENLGKEVNSEFPDYYPLITQDEFMMVFTSRRRGPGAQLEIDGYYPSDIYITTVKNGAWQKPKSVGAMINTRYDEQATGLTPDGQNLIIYLDHIDSLGNIYICENKRGNFQRPVKLNQSVNSDFETSGAISSDGQIIFFASERKGGMGETDIYMARKLPTGQWALPQNLGKNINTKYREDFPRLADDGKTLYFASQGHSSMGHFDLFKASWDAENNTWSSPQNLGYPVNTSDDERCITFTADQRVGYISAARDGGHGDLDIYRITFNDIEQRIAVISGYLLPDSSFAGKKEIDAMITVVNTKTNDEFQFRPAAATGKYIMALPPGKYSMEIQAPGFKTIKDDIIVFDMGSFQPETAKDYQLVKSP